MKGGGRTLSPSRSTRLTVCVCVELQTSPPSNELNSPDLQSLLFTPNTVQLPNCPSTCVQLLWCSKNDIITANHESVAKVVLSACDVLDGKEEPLGGHHAPLG